MMHTNSQTYSFGKPVDILICTETKFSYVKSTSLNIEFRNVSFYGKVFLFCMYSRSCHQRPCFCQTKKVVGDRKSLVTGISFCCKICRCGGWFNVGLMTESFTHHWLVIIVDQSTWLRQHSNACSNITDYDSVFSEWPLATLITLTEHTLYKPR